MAIVTVSSPYSNASASLYKAWAQSFGNAFTTFGWTAQTGHGEVAASGTGGSYAWTNVVAGPGTAAVIAPGNVVFQGAWVSGNTYVGIGITADGNSNVDVVTDGGLTYIHTTTTSNSATAPGSDSTNWAPYNFEIWKSTGSMSTTFPMYIKIAYVQSVSLANGPGFTLSVGTGVDSNGNLTGTYKISSTTPFHTIRANPTGTVSALSWSMNFSGDSDNFRFALWRNYGSTNGPVLVLDRAKTASGGDSDSYVYFGHTIGSNTNIMSGIALKNALGGGTIMFDSTKWSGSIAHISGTMANFGSALALPIFPMVGFIGNPCLGVMCFPRTDTTDGSIIPVWLYGATHLYLVAGNMNAAQSPNGTTSAQYAAILWE